MVPSEIIGFTCGVSLTDNYTAVWVEKILVCTGVPNIDLFKRLISSIS